MPFYKDTLPSKGVVIKWETRKSEGTVKAHILK